MNKKNIVSNSSIIYAKALFQYAEDRGNLINVSEQLQKVCELIDTSADLKIVLDNPSISKLKKHEIIESIFRKIIDEKLLNFVKILIDKDRFSEIYNISIAFDYLLNQNLNKKNIEIVSSFELDNNLKKTITASVQKKLNADVSIDWSVDSSILAGLVFKFDDNIVDLCIKTKLENLGKNLLR